MSLDPARLLAPGRVSVFDVSIANDIVKNLATADLLRKIFAYKVAKHREGIYFYYQVRTTHGELVHELERRLGVQDSVIKYQTIRLDEELKRQKKLTHKREQRAARRPRRITQPTPAEQQASAS